MSERHVLLAADAVDLPRESAHPAETDSTGTPDPTRSETRLRRPAEIAAPSPSRASIRPSAFGPPHPSSRPPQQAGAAAEDAPEVSACLTGMDGEPAAASADAPGLEPARVPVEASPSVPRLRRGVRGFVASLPWLRPAWFAALRRPGSAGVRKPLVSIALFCSVLSLSAVTLLRSVRPKAASRSTPAAVSEARRALQAAAALAPQPRVVVMARNWPDAPAPEASAPAAAPEPQLDRAEQILALRREADRAFARRQVAEAEQLYARILELEADNPRAAFGYARIRLLQGNLAGAESWVQLAIRKRPRRASYHAFYAEILGRLGRDEQAAEEQLRAAEGVQSD